MKLTWYGLSCFRITQSKYAAVVTDPYGESLGLGAPKLRADVVTVSHEARGHSNVDAVSGYEHVLDGPGEYEIGSVFITSTASDNKINGRNVLFLFDYGGVTVAHLGDMRKVPTQNQIEALEEVNVLLVPVGGGQSLNAAQAAELVSMLEPNIVIPMHYHLPQLKIELDGVDRFLKEMGVTDPEPEDNLKVYSTRLPEETEVVLLSPKL
jgi:L-ascorbate metabolism protein UlaG (beta-lactamase superfamily)